MSQNCTITDPITGKWKLNCQISQICFNMYYDLICIMICRLKRVINATFYLFIIYILEFN